jgi:hypothetical protein
VRSIKFRRAKCLIYDPNTASKQCDKPIVARGRCRNHYDALMKGFGVRGKALDEQLAAERVPHFEWLGDEDSLAAMTEKQEAEKKGERS